VRRRFWSRVTRAVYIAAHEANARAVHTTSAASTAARSAEKGARHCLYRFSASAPDVGTVRIVALKLSKAPTVV
jgi:hypothetical protein